MSDLHELTAAQQLNELRDGSICSRDLTEHYLDRIERFADLGAFVTVTAELARSEAARADERLAAGERAPLLGLPLGIKDLHATAGVRTTFGSATLADHVPAEDSWTVGLLRRAGAVLVGKTNGPELGATCYTHNDVTERPAVTPWDTTRYSSGSSGGAATAVAAGLIPVGHASDGAGSTRTPAATCHLVGVKPTRGLVSPAPAMSFLSAGTEGPLARTVEDAALLLDVMASPAPGDLYGWRPTGSFTEAITRPPRPLRVAVWSATGVEGVDAHPQAVAAVERATSVLRGLGHDVEQVDLPAPLDATVRTALRNWFGSSIELTVSTVVPQDRRGLLRPYTSHLVATGAALSGHDVVTTQAVLARYAGAFLAALDRFDVAVTPTTNGPAVPVDHYFADGPEGEPERMLAWSCHTPWVNLTGQPAVSVPTHVDEGGLPHAVQLVGRPRSDGELLALAAQLELAGLWDDVHPPCWDQ